MTDIGHNSGADVIAGLAASDQRVLFMHHLNAIEAQDEKIKAEQAEMRKLRKRAKADGITLADVDFAMRCLNTDDDNIIVQEMQRRLMVMRWTNLPVGAQASILDNGPAEDVAYDKGVTAAMRGESLNNPYDPSVPQFKKYAEGYHDGQKQMRDNLAEIMERNNAAAANDGDDGDDDDEEEDGTDGDGEFDGDEETVH